MTTVWMKTVNNSHKRLNELCCQTSSSSSAAAAAAAVADTEPQSLNQLSTVDSRAFPVVAARVWNGLPEAVVSSSSLQTFHRQLKTHLFRLSCPHLIFWPFDWHCYSGPCSNVRYLGHSCLLTYLLTQCNTQYTVQQRYEHHRTV